MVADVEFRPARGRPLRVCSWNSQAPSAMFHVNQSARTPASVSRESFADAEPPENLPQDRLGVDQPDQPFEFETGEPQLLGHKLQR